MARLFEAARWAASSFGEQPWAFIMATKEQPAEYQRLLGCLVEFNQSWAKSAPVLMVTVAEMAFARNGQPNRHALHDVGAAMAQLTVQATAEGLVVHQMAGILPDVARQTLAIPAGWEPVAGVAARLPRRSWRRLSEESVQKPARRRHAASGRSRANSSSKVVGATRPSFRGQQKERVRWQSWQRLYLSDARNAKEVNGAGIHSGFLGL